MNFRRLTRASPFAEPPGSPEDITFEGGATCASQQIWRPMFQLGHERPSHSVPPPRFVRCT
jgi:hypothetical protein